MATENSFLSGIKVDQFIKANNEQIKQTVSSSFSDLNKSVSELIKLQKITVVELKKSNDKKDESKGLKKSLDSTIRSIQKENLKMSKMRDATLLKSLKGFFSNSKKELSAKKESKDFFRREDFNKKSNSLLSTISKNIEAFLKKDKDDKKESLLSKIMGVAGFLGKALAIGGLAGFLLTGKKEFLFDMIKGVKWIVKSALFPIQFILKGIPTLIKGIHAGFKGIQTLGKSIQTGFKIAQKMGARAALEYGARTGAKAVAGVGSRIAGSAVGKKVGSVVASKSLKMGAKTVAKTVGKSALKKIPVIGAVMGIGFGIARIQKGDVIGGLMEFASGAAGIIPGVGTAISLGIDGLLLAKDIHDATKSKSPKTPAGANTINIASSAKVSGDAYPIKDKKTHGGLKRALKVNISKLMDKFNPKDDKGETLIGKSVGGVKQLLDVGGTEVTSMANNLLHNVLPLPKDPNNPGYYLNSQKVNITGINPQMWGNFLGMASEYKARTGKTIGINSAYRSLEDQKMLWDRYGHNPKRVAPPGKSMHNYGFAMDINSSSGNALHSLGLLQKWNFARPMAHEPWHIEPVGLKEKYADVRAGTYTGGDSGSEVGDAYSIKNSALGALKDLKNVIPQQVNNKSNLPMGDIANKLQNTKPMQVLLGTSDINALATAIGEAMKKALPEPKTNHIPMSSGGRGSI